jgi:uncharacterized protein (DUF433 family)
MPPLGNYRCSAGFAANCYARFENGMNPLLERISADPNVCFGRPCIRGTRIRVSHILDLLAAGTAIDELLEEYPQLERQDILAAIAYDAEMSRGRFVDLPGSSAA